MERRVLGITGLMASGKSEAAAYLRREWGMAEIDVDRVGHVLLPTLREPLRRAFGDDILDEAGEVSRPALARVVFGESDAARRSGGEARTRAKGHKNPDGFLRHLTALRSVRREAEARGASPRPLETLEGIIHPAMKEEISRILEHSAGRGEAHIIINAALLYRMGLHEYCDSVLFIDAPREVCAAREQARRGRSPEEIQRILDRQEDVNTSRDSADVVIGNAASPEEFRERMRAFAQTYFGSQADGNAPNAECDARRTQEGSVYP